MTDQAQDTADHIDSEVLAKLYKAGKALDKEPVPLIGRYFWNPLTNEVERIDTVLAKRR